MTNNYILSTFFKKDLDYAQKAKKFIIIIILESINPEVYEDVSLNLNQMNVIDVYNESVFLKEELNNPLWYLINSMLNLDGTNELMYNFRLFDDFESVHDVISIARCSNMLKKESKFMLFDIAVNNHLIIVNDTRNLFIFNRQNLNFIKKCQIKTIEPIQDICFVKCINKLTYISTDHLYTMNLDYSGSELKWEFPHDCLKCICYDEKTDRVYLLTKYENKTVILNGELLDKMKEACMEEIKNPIKTMKIIKDSIYYLTNEEIFVYDLEVNLIAKLGVSIISNAKGLLYNPMNDYFFVIDRDTIKIFGCINYKYYGSIDLYMISNFNYQHIILNESYFFFCSKNKIFTLKSNFIQSNFKPLNCVNDRYICKMNLFNVHLLKNPYELPCGNISCLDCIHENYNYYKNEFKCGFQGCKMKHFLKNQLKKSNIIETNFFKICKNHLEYFNIKEFEIATKRGLDFFLYIFN